MTRQEQKDQPRWKVPRLERIGSISDVAGRPVPVSQDSGNRKS